MFAARMEELRRRLDTAEGDVALITAYMYINRASLAGLTLDRNWLKTPSELAE